MIQQTNTRQPSSAIAPPQQTSTDGPEDWGQWAGRRYYSLEVVQHPLRARMCGFGDKDRRPLAPAAVAKMVVRGEDHSVIDVDDVDCSFFLVTVDLWSADGKKEMNLVLHPSSTDRYVPANSAKQRRRGTSSSAGPQTRPGNQTPATRSTPTPQFRNDQPSTGTTTPMAPQTPAYSNNNGNNNNNIQGSDGGSSGSWQQQQQPQHEPSSGGSNSGSDMQPYRAWNPDAPYHPGSSEGFPNQSGPLRGGPPPNPDPSSAPVSRYAQDGYGNGNGTNTPSSAVAASGAVDQSIYAPASYAQHAGQVQEAYYTSPYPPAGPGASGHGPAGLPLARHTYTRTLVGPLSANACRLLDEHRKPGIFFLFQDLSVRTEGTFRLRLRLMNVGAPPAPERGATRVHTDVSPVLAQTFTDSFVVFSAKRFPGVPPTTALSIALGNQGQKLPLRNRHGNKRRRQDESESDDDSDGE